MVVRGLLSFGVILLAAAEAGAANPSMADKCFKWTMIIIALIGAIALLWLIPKTLWSIGRAADKFSQSTDKFLQFIDNVSKFINEDLKPHLNCYRLMAYRINEFMAKVAPDVVDKLVEKDVVSKRAAHRWYASISADMAQTASPRELSDLGQKVLGDSGVRDAIDDSLDNLLDQMEELNLDNLADIEQVAYDFLKDKLEKEGLDSIKKYLYENPAANLNDVLYVGSIYLRKMYADRHPEILVDEGDSQ